MKVKMTYFLNLGIPDFPVLPPVHFSILLLISFESLTLKFPENSDELDNYDALIKILTLRDQRGRLGHTVHIAVKN